jgi:hypothetical protein
MATTLHPDKATLVVVLMVQHLLAVAVVVDMQQQVLTAHKTLVVLVAQAMTLVRLFLVHHISFLLVVVVLAGLLQVAQQEALVQVKVVELVSVQTAQHATVVVVVETQLLVVAETVFKA